jgi:SAM-dependent methyltransferase
LNRYEFFATIERYHTFQNPTSEEKLDPAISYCDIRDGMRILDVGCGKGWLARRLAQRFRVQITGLEINRIFSAEAHQLAAAENVADRIEVVQRLALDFHATPASFDVVMGVGASFALGGFEPALEWMKSRVKPTGIVAIGEVFAKVLPLADNVASHRRIGALSLWTTADKIRARGLLLRGIVESSVDDWNRYHSLHWQAALDWTLAHPDSPDAALMLDPEGQCSDLERDRRALGWTIFVARKSSRTW